jgi:hypothetical protein
VSHLTVAGLLQFQLVLPSVLRFLAADATANGGLQKALALDWLERAYQARHSGIATNPSARHPASSSICSIK